ncbi:24493_t:CDS:2, partial [Dentiscutata erythropus]
RDKLYNLIKQKSTELQSKLKNCNKTNKMIIKNELPVQTEGWKNVTPTIVQAMAIQLTDTEAQCQNLAKKLRLLQENVESLQNKLENNLNSSSEESEMSDSDELDFLSISEIINTLTTKGELGVYQNESQNMNFSQAVAGAGLAARTNREELKTILAFCRITRQSGYKQYFNYQDIMHNSIIETAKMSAKTGLNAVIET